VNDRVADFREAQGRVKRVGSRIGRRGVHFAGYDRVAGLPRLLEQRFVEAARMAAPARGLGDDDAVDIDKALVARAKPQEIGALVVRILVEGHDEGFDLADAPRVKTLAEQVSQPLRFQP
jgi:hypothetical protein